MAERRNGQAVRWRLLAERCRDRLSAARGFAPLTSRPAAQESELPHTGLDERHSDQWRRIGLPAWRHLKRSIVAAAQAGAISGPTAERLIKRFNLKGL